MVLVDVGLCRWWLLVLLRQWVWVAVLVRSLFVVVVVVDDDNDDEEEEEGDILF